jgi:hypothetical protein
MDKIKTYVKPKSKFVKLAIRTSILASSNRSFDIDYGDGGNVAEAPKKRCLFK